MSGQVHVIAIFTLKAGKFERAKELLTAMATEVQAKEANALRYHLLEETSADGNPSIIVDELYASQADFDAHKDTDSFKNLFKTMREEDLAESAVIKQAKSFAGYGSR